MPAPASPLLLNPAGPLAAEHAPGGGCVDLVLFPAAAGEAPVRVRLTGHQVQLLLVSVRHAQQSEAPDADERPVVNPARGAAARGGLSPAEWLARTFAAVLPPSRAASSSSTNARNAGSSSSAVSAPSAAGASSAARFPD